MSKLYLMLCSDNSDGGTFKFKPHSLWFSADKALAYSEEQEHRDRQPWCQFEVSGPYYIEDDGHDQEILRAVRDTIADMERKPGGMKAGPERISKYSLDLVLSIFEKDGEFEVKDE